MPRCSVIIPAYNVERYAGAAVDSALSQTHSDLEVIVVNDGSTDSTAETLRPYRDRIVYVEQSNRGLAAARNRAIEAATGEYVALLDADDRWMPQRAERMVAHLQAHPEFALATSDSFLIYGDRVSNGTYYGSRPRRLRFRSDDQPHWITQYNFVHIMVVARRETFERHGLFDETLRTCEDWDLWIRMITGGERAGFVDEPLGYYRVRPGSLSNVWTEISADELTVLERALARPECKNIRGLGGRINFQRGRRAFIEGDRRRGAKYFAEAAKDSGIDLGTRARARFAATLPMLASRLYLRRLKVPGGADPRD